MQMRVCVKRAVQREFLENVALSKHPGTPNCSARIQALTHFVAT